MGRRQQLQTRLETLKGTDPEDKLVVYFQPKPNITLEYPCIVYKRDTARNLFADNIPYRNVKRYAVTVMDRDADSPIVELVSNLPMCELNRTYTVADLHHDVFNLFF